MVSAVQRGAIYGVSRPAVCVCVCARARVPGGGYVRRRTGKSDSSWYGMSALPYLIDSDRRCRWMDQITAVTNERRSLR
jgi:hypothetical protein